MSTNFNMNVEYLISEKPIIRQNQNYNFKETSINCSDQDNHVNSDQSNVNSNKVGTISFNRKRRLENIFNNNKFAKDKIQKLEHLVCHLEGFKKREMHSLNSLKAIYDLYFDLKSECHGVRKCLQKSIKNLNIDVLIGAAKKAAYLKNVDCQFDIYADKETYSLSYLYKTKPDNIINEIKEIQEQYPNNFNNFKNNILTISIISSLQRIISVK
ncbi:1528_t:CDS:1 [Gigaspora margarita]|uniref:1528_t:CDS:1 n=1 Tax=Gigaspora margarita TaxID=4874 RepID=A0ABM8VXI6_GIGMA|nr:1528_t:CDS:1 [Gigaspora margarita]